MPSIPASQIVSSAPSVLSAGGTALDLIGLMLTANTRVPIGTVPSFQSAPAVAAYFGPTSQEAALAAIYFLGFDNSNVKPGALLFSQYPTAPVAAYLRGANVSGFTLTQLQAMSGTITVVFNGTTYTSSSINLTSATSFSSAAALIQAAFTSPPFSVSYDSVSGAFVFTGSTTGPAATVGAASGSLATLLLLTPVLGAVTSQGAAAATPSAAMTAVTGITQNWASFMTVFEPVLNDKVAFGQWANSTDDRYLYAMWDTNSAPAGTSDTSSAGALLTASQASGTAPIYLDVNVAAFLLGALASIDYTEENGRATMAFKTQSGLSVDVVSGTISANLKANSYNYYGQFSTANDNFNWFYPGSVTGPFAWIDSYVNQIWMTNAFQLAIMTLFANTKSIPFVTAGYALVSAALADPILAAANFGAFQPGVALSQAQIAEINSAAGAKIDGVLNQQGYYLQVLPATAQVRGVRGPLAVTFWYADGGSVQSLAISSVEIQ